MATSLKTLGPLHLSNVFRIRSKFALCLLYQGLLVRVLPHGLCYPCFSTYVILFLSPSADMPSVSGSFEQGSDALISCPGSFEQGSWHAHISCPGTLEQGLSSMPNLLPRAFRARNPKCPSWTRCKQRLLKASMIVCQYISTV